MSDLVFTENWIVILNANPDYNRESPDYPELMKLHFEFIDHHLSLGNLFVAIPMSTGGLYIFDGELSEEEMNSMLENEGSIQGGVFLPDLRKGYFPDGHIMFTVQQRKRMEEFHETRRSNQA